MVCCAACAAWRACARVLHGRVHATWYRTNAFCDRATATSSTTSQADSQRIRTKDVYDDNARASDKPQLKSSPCRDGPETSRDGFFLTNRSHAQVLVGESDGAAFTVCCTNVCAHGGCEQVKVAETRERLERDEQRRGAVELSTRFKMYAALRLLSCSTTGSPPFSEDFPGLAAARVVSSFFNGRCNFNRVRQPDLIHDR